MPVLQNIERLLGQSHRPPKKRHQSRALPHLFISRRVTMASAAEPLAGAVSLLSVTTEANARDEGLAAFISVRPRLFGIAYRMLGSAAEAEDVVQDVWMRWQSTNRNAIVNPAAYLATTATRLCINLVQSAHTRREAY